ncbi:hypothetical protein ANN_13922 [Periplaneta americana]|uniref:Transposase n=1 Tax=Periplaneta americana TaxID=6978 RepID=A0ABQ8SUW0_PERAM|nr:hypothetical protein ANN_13922 [Periplaneta americana]
MPCPSQMSGFSVPNMSGEEYNASSSSSSSSSGSGSGSSSSSGGGSSGGDCSSSSSGGSGSSSSSSSGGSGSSSNSGCSGSSSSSSGGGGSGSSSDGGSSSSGSGSNSSSGSSSSSGGGGSGGCGGGGSGGIVVVVVVVVMLVVLYQERYPQRQCPDRKTFVRLHYRLCEYEKFNSPDLGRGRPRSTTPEVQEKILEAVNMTPSISSRRVALQVWRLLKEYQLYPYHLQRVQALKPADYPARVRFCQWFLQQCGVNPNFPALVLFTDEAQFTRDGITNFHTQHVWAYENPRATVPSHHQVRISLNMWAGIIGDRLVGPHVLVNRLTGQAYTNFMENTIPHILEDTPLINRQTHSLHA